MASMHENKDVRALWQVYMSHEWEWGCGRAPVRPRNKGFARRPQEFLEGLYVAIPAFGGEWEREWEWDWGCARAAAK